MPEHAPSPSDVMKTDREDDRQGFQTDDDKQMIFFNEGGIAFDSHSLWELKNMWY